MVRRRHRSPDDPSTDSSAVRALLLAVLVLSGCAMPQGAPSPSNASGRAPMTDPSGISLNVTPPDLPVGRMWTYKASMLWDTPKEVHIVVASKNASGYLFAGATREDVVGPAIWGRAYFGAQRLDLTPVDESVVFLSFPLFDGKTWRLGSRLNVTAHKATVRGVDGFVIEGLEHDHHIRIEYAPSAGYVSRYLDEVKGRVFFDLQLTSMGTSSKFVWFERGPSSWAGGGAVDLPAPPPARPPASARRFDVPDGWGALLVSTGGDHGRALVAGPRGESFQFAQDGDERWDAAVLPATAGAWALTATNASQPGFAYVQAQAVRWIEGTPGVT